MNKYRELVYVYAVSAALIAVILGGVLFLAWLEAWIWG